MPPSIAVIPLGAGQDVGRSCILVTLGGKKVMLDCGAHMGLRDKARFPDFGFVTRLGSATSVVSVVIITHFHLDHVGALPIFTEQIGYAGPIVMTHPTRALSPVMLEDYRKVMVERRGETSFYTAEDVTSCMSKVTPIQLHQTVVVNGVEITPFYAGHVLGAAMFRIAVGPHSVVYTGDFNTSSDHHLGPAWIERCYPDVLITETTCASVTRDSKLCKEAELLHRIHDCVSGGGKVLIPVFAVGRAQEFCVMLDEYWQRVGLKVPILCSGGLLSKATKFYKLFLDWTNERTRGVSSASSTNPFDYKHISNIDDPLSLSGPCVLFATPGMLNGGTSLEVFKAWAGDSKNLVIFPGYCLYGTVGHRVLAGETSVQVGASTVNVKCGVHNVSFSGHADGKGVMQMVRRISPRNVVLVHGEAGKMELFKQRVISELKLPCFNPGNHTRLLIEVPPSSTPVGEPAPEKRLKVDATSFPASSTASAGASAGDVTVDGPVLTSSEALEYLGSEEGFSFDASSCCTHSCAE